MARTILETIKAATKLTEEELASIVSKDLSPVEQLLVWRIKTLEERLNRQDSDGEIKVLVRNLQKDVVEHEVQHKEVAREQKIGRRWFIGIVVALVVPLYPFIGIMLFGKH